MFMVALGGERETVGDAIFGALTSRLSVLQDEGFWIERGGKGSTKCMA